MVEGKLSHGFVKPVFLAFETYTYMDFDVHNFWSLMSIIGGYICPHFKGTHHNMHL